MNGIHQPLPKARRSELITKEVAGEMLVYDRNSDEAHCLNPTAARVWAYCDGTTTVAEVARLLTDEMQTPIAAEFVWLALEQLRKSQLLQEPPFKGRLARPAHIEQVSRRALVKRMGVAAAVTVPFIRSITAPTAAQAASCLPTSAACTANSQCCSNNCLDNGRGGFQCT